MYFHLGWDKQSYGYHGDDGHSFSSSGNGQPYGPTFTTNDIIGCGVNLVDNTCFYTKNGHHLGTAFKDLPVRGNELQRNLSRKDLLICVFLIDFLDSTLSNCWLTDTGRSS